MRQNIIAGIIAGIVFTLASCSSNKELPMYVWYGYENAAYNYTKIGTEESAETLLGVYQQIVDGQSETKRQVPPPGICADYGYMLIQAGKTEEGKELLLKEKELYPESAKYIDGILRMVR